MEELELLRECDDLRLEGSLMRPPLKAGQAGDWAELSKSDRLNAWTGTMLRECHSEVEQDDEEWKSIVQQFLHMSTDFLRRIIVPVDGQGGVTPSYVCPHCHRYPHDCIWWVSSGRCPRRTRSSATGGVLHVAASTAGEIRTECRLDRIVRAAVKHMFFERMLRLMEYAANLINALKLLVNQQTES